MPLPDNFSEFEFLQDLMRKWQNRIVREEFAHLGGEDWNPDISISEGAVRHACTHKDNDTAEMFRMRMDAFYILHRKYKDYMPTIVGTPKTNYDRETKYKPQVKLYFCETSSPDKEDNDYKEGDITFRLMYELSKSSIDSRLFEIGREIKNIFGRGNGYDWHKGYYKYVYLELARGYDFRLYAYSETEARRLITDVMKIQDHTPDWDYLNSVTPENASNRFPANPGTQRILGKTCKKPEQRPRVHVKFRYASLLVHGLPDVITLYDTTGTRKDPLVK